MTCHVCGKAFDVAAVAVEAKGHPWALCGLEAEVVKDAELVGVGQCIGAEAGQAVPGLSRVLCAAKAPPRGEQGPLRLSKDRKFNEGFIR